MPEEQVIWWFVRPALHGDQPPVCFSRRAGSQWLTDGEHSHVVAFEPILKRGLRMIVLGKFWGKCWELRKGRHSRLVWGVWAEAAESWERIGEQNSVTVCSLVSGEEGSVCGEGCGRWLGHTWLVTRAHVAKASGAGVREGGRPVPDSGVTASRAPVPAPGDSAGGGWLSLFDLRASDAESAPPSSGFKVMTHLLLLGWPY